MNKLKSKYSLHQTFLTSFILLSEYMPKKELLDFLNNIKHEYEYNKSSSLEPFHANTYTFYWCTFLFIKYKANSIVNSFLKIIFKTKLSILEEFIFTFLTTSYFCKIDLNKQFIKLMIELNHEILSNKTLFQLLHIVVKLILLAFKTTENVEFEDKDLGTYEKIIKSQSIKNITFLRSNSMNYYEIGINMISILLNISNFGSEKDLIIILVCELIKNNSENIEIPISILSKLFMTSNNIDFIMNELKDTSIDCNFLYLFPININNDKNMKSVFEEYLKNWESETKDLQASIQAKINVLK